VRRILFPLFLVMAHCFVRDARGGILAWHRARKEQEMVEHLQRPWAYRVVRRVVIAVIGGTIVLLGVAMLVLPGPGLLTIAAGLAVLGVEFAFARRWLQRAKQTTHQAVRMAGDRLGRRDDTVGPNHQA
jgi:uncharacterized protein (TIGR02611 family)